MSLICISEEWTAVVPLAHEPLFVSPDESLASPLLACLGLQKKRYVLGVAQHHPRKNTAVILDAWARLQGGGAVSGLVLLFVGSAKACRQIEQLAKRVGVFESVRSVRADDRESAALSAVATMLVYVPFYDGFGIPVLEAMPAGCLVATSRRVHCQRWGVRRSFMWTHETARALRMRCLQC